MEREWFRETLVVEPIRRAVKRNAPDVMERECKTRTVITVVVAEEYINHGIRIAHHINHGIQPGQLLTDHRVDTVRVHPPRFQQLRRRHILFN